jgi:hypothetical protein
VKFKKIKKLISESISVLINAHSKFLLILVLSLVSFTVMYFYISPPSQDIQHAPIQFLPARICEWRGADVPTGIRFKNNQYKSAVYFDPLSGVEVQIISYQRRNEKYNQIHYPEDCLRSVGIYDFKESFVPLTVAGKTIVFKRLYGEDNSRGILHYYVILTKAGENYFYDKPGAQLFGLLLRKYSLQRAQEQMFRFTCQLRHQDKYKLGLADQKIVEFIQGVPKEFWPK